MRSKMLTVCLLTFVFCWLVLCWHQFWPHWFPDDIPCCGSRRNAGHIALTSCEHSLSSAASSSPSPPSRPPASTLPAKTMFFFECLWKRHSVILDLPSCLLGRTLLYILTFGPMKKPKKAPLHRHHLNLYCPSSPSSTSYHQHHVLVHAMMSLPMAQG